MIGLISASKHQLVAPAPAWLLYSDIARFNQQLMYLEARCKNQIMIVSCKHGVIDRNQPVNPYRHTFDDMDSKAYENWTDKCYEQLKVLGGPFLSLLPNDYAVILKDLEHEAPFKGLDAIKVSKGIGAQPKSPRQLNPQVWPTNEILLLVWKSTPTPNELKMTALGKGLDRRSAQKVVETTLACPLHEISEGKIINKYAKDAI